MNDEILIVLGVVSEETKGCVGPGIETAEGDEYPKSGNPPTC